MNILMINPNTSRDFTQKMQIIVDQYALPTTEVRAAISERGPRSIENIYDELLSSPGTLELEQAGDQETRTKISAAAREAVQDDQAEVICLGCAGMTGLEKEIGVPVLDGAAAALKFMEGMIGYGLSTSKRQAHSRPYHKQLVNISSMFEEVYQQQDH
jgi:Asp/Glu/hydantoin racemase